MQRSPIKISGRVEEFDDDIDPQKTKEKISVSSRLSMAFGKELLADNAMKGYINMQIGVAAAGLDSKNVISLFGRGLPYDDGHSFQHQPPSPLEYHVTYQNGGLTFSDGMLRAVAFYSVSKGRK